MKICVAAVLALGLGTGAGRVLAQPPELPAPLPAQVFSGEFENTSVRDLMRLIAGLGQTKVTFTSEAGPRSERTIAKIAFTNLTAEQALRQAAQMSGLSVTVEGKGFRLDKDPQVGVLATKARPDRNLWQDGDWKAVAKPFVLCVRLAGEEGTADEVVQELQVSEREAFACIVRRAGVSYGVQGRSGSVVDKDGLRQLPVHLRVSSVADSNVIVGEKVSSNVDRDVQVPLDESEVPLQLGTQDPFRPTLSAHDNADYTAPK